MRALRADREKEMEEEFVGDRPVGIIRPAILSANLAELARPVRDEKRAGLVLERCVECSPRIVVAQAREPPLTELIVTTHVRAERVGIPEWLTAAAPEELCPTNHAAVDRATQRPVSHRGVNANDACRSVRTRIVMAVCDRGTNIHVRAFRHVTIAAQASNVRQVAPLRALEQVVRPTEHLPSRLEKKDWV